MTKFFFFLLLSTSLAQAAPKYVCEMDEYSGNVYMKTADRVKGSKDIEFVSMIGREAIANPYKVRKECNALALKLNSRNGVRSLTWVDFGCDGWIAYELLNVLVVLNEKNIYFYPRYSTDEAKKKVYRQSKDQLKNDRCSGH